MDAGPASWPPWDPRSLATVFAGCADSNLVYTHSRMFSVKVIVETLNQHHQRATYGAVAGLLGKVPRSVMSGYPRDWKHSWVVNQADGAPTDYPAPKVHPALYERPRVLTSAEELAAWLRDPR